MEYNTTTPQTTGTYTPTTVTVGNTSNCVTYWPPQQDNTLYGFNWTYPAYCSGDTHVWACSHTSSCKCGKASRIQPICPGCGK